MNQNAYIEPGTQQNAGNMDTKTAGEIIRSIRRAKGLTQKQLSELSGVSYRVIQNIEYGKNPTMDSYLAALTALGYTFTPEKLPEEKK
jgi:transcriptional regulator with XRE-family HTH domain